MLQRFRKVRQDDSGFTLTELLIVIVILGILTGIVVFAVGAFTDRGEVAACKSDKKAVEVAAEAYRANTGHYPDALTSVDRLLQLKTDEYLREVPGTTNYTITIDDAGQVTGSIC